MFPLITLSEMFSGAGFLKSGSEKLPIPPPKAPRLFGLVLTAWLSTIRLWLMFMVAPLMRPPPSATISPPAGFGFDSLTVLLLITLFASVVVPRLKIPPPRVPIPLVSSKTVFRVTVL